MTLLSDMTSLNEPVYLGDGLYAQFDGWQIELYAWNGISKTNRVFLEPAVLATFESYLTTLRAMIAKA
jgi:hypothetical protein